MSDPTKKKLTPRQAAACLRGMADSEEAEGEEDAARLVLAGFKAAELLETWRLLGETSHRHNVDRLADRLVAWPARQRAATSMHVEPPSTNRDRRDHRPLSALGELPPAVSLAIGRCGVTNLGDLRNLMLRTGDYRGVYDGLSPDQRADLRERLVRVIDGR